VSRSGTRADLSRLRLHRVRQGKRYQAICQPQTMLVTSRRRSRRDGLVPSSGCSGLASAERIRAAFLSFGSARSARASARPTHVCTQAGTSPASTPVDAQVALVGDALLFVEVPGAVGARDDAVLAADALVGIYDDDPVRSSVGRLRGQTWTQGASAQCMHDHFIGAWVPAEAGGAILERPVPVGHPVLDPAGDAA